jgi:cobalt/nickel transport protein
MMTAWLRLDRSLKRKGRDMMPRCVAVAILLVAWAAGVPSADAHYNMLLPAKASVKKGEAVTFTYQWGHPFEHELFDAPMPEGLIVLAPDGTKIDLLKKLTKISVPANEGKKATAYQFDFTAEQRGDYVFLLTPQPIWMEEEQEFFQDAVKVVLHVQAQKGWDTPAGGAFEMLPLTRPYGLLAGMVFQAQARAEGKPRGAAHVEVESYNSTPPKELPPDEHITRTAKTDPNGVVSATLTEPGWWGMTALRDGGRREREGKMVPVRQRSTLWVYVDDKAALKPGK